MGFIHLLFIIYFFVPNPLEAGECKVWFKESGLSKGKNCLLKCASIKVDMNTFNCPNMCLQLCKAPKKESFIFELSNLYPGLTAEERALSEKYPLKMLSAYKLSWKAEKLCSKIYKSSRTNDASDACRHFIWAAFLYQKYGADFSTQVLDAHEQDFKQDKTERAMDIANNRIGQVLAEQLLQKNKFNEKELLKSFKEKLKKGRFIILKESSGGKK